MIYGTADGEVRRLNLENLLKMKPNVNNIIECSYLDVDETPIEQKKVKENSKENS